MIQRWRGLVTTLCQQGENYFQTSFPACQTAGAAIGGPGARIASFRIKDLIYRSLSLAGIPGEK